MYINTDQDFFLFLLVKKLASDFMPVLSTFARDFCAAVSFVTCRTYHISESDYINTIVSKDTQALSLRTDSFSKSMQLQ